MRWIIIMLLFPAVMTAQEYRVTGRVVDNSTGYPLIGANVVVKYRDGTDSIRTHGAATDAEGEFVILIPANNRPGPLRLMIAYIGFEKHQMQFPSSFQNRELSLGSIALKSDPFSPHPEPVHDPWRVWRPFGYENEKATNFRTVIYHEQLMATPLF